MRKLTIDLGIEEFEIAPGKILRFNPADINLFDRFCLAMNDIQAEEEEMEKKAKDMGEEASAEDLLRLLAETDSRIKKIFSGVFGTGNDFEDIFCGVNLMSVGTNDERVATNFINAVFPILEEGAKRAAKNMAIQDAEQIKMNRQQRRAQA